MEINNSNFAHAGLAVAAQIILALILVFLAPWSFTACLTVGAAFSIGFYYGREVDQVEKKYNRTPWWVGFKWSLWTTDGKFDFIFPLVMCLLVIGIWVGVMALL